MGRPDGEGVALSALCPTTPMERPMSQFFDASRSLTALEQDSTIIAAIEMSQSKWLVAAVGAKRSLAQTDGRTIELWGGISAPRRDLENRVFDSGHCPLDCLPKLFGGKRRID